MGQNPEAKETSPRKRLADAIIPHILNLYGSRATPSDFEIYAPNASFEDPLIRAQGVKQIKSAFYSLSKVFSESRIVEYNVTENMLSSGSHEILIDNKQYYKFFGRDIDVTSLIKLYVSEGKIVRHEDCDRMLWGSLTKNITIEMKALKITTLEVGEEASFEQRNNEITTDWADYGTES